MRKVIVESPFKGVTPSDRERNITYARQCMKDCLRRGEAPLAFHLLYTQPGVLDDSLPDERAHGIAAGQQWYKSADAVVVYVDRGTSPGMEAGIRHAHILGVPVEYRLMAAIDVPIVNAASALATVNVSSLLLSNRPVYRPRYIILFNPDVAQIFRIARDNDDVFVFSFLTASKYAIDAVPDYSALSVDENDFTSEAARLCNRIARPVYLSEQNYSVAALAYVKAAFKPICDVTIADAVYIQLVD